MNFRPSSKVKNFEVKELIFIIYLFQIAVVNDLDNCAKSVDKLKKYLVGHKNVIQENDSRASQKQLSETDSESIKTAIVEKLDQQKPSNSTNIRSKYQAKIKKAMQEAVITLAEVSLYNIFQPCSSNIEESKSEENNKEVLLSNLRNEEEQETTSEISSVISLASDDIFCITPEFLGAKIENLKHRFYNTANYGLIFFFFLNFNEIYFKYVA